MTRNHKIATLAAALALVTAATTSAQVVPAPTPAGGQTADQNVIPTTTRVPGAMVSNGIVRATQTLRDPLAGVNITEPRRNTILEDFAIEANPVVAEELEDALVFIFERFLARMGIEIPNLADLINLPQPQPPEDNNDPPTVPSRPGRGKTR